MVEACDRVLAPHGSMCIELGDTYAGSATTKGGWKEGEEGFKQNYRDRVHDGVSKVGIYNLDGYTPPGGEGWPLAKSLSLIPELFRLTLVYGTNPLTGRTTERWRLRNVVRWVRPNPPVGALGDKFRPATSELMVFCKSAKRYFDLDAVRQPHVNDRPQLTNGAKNVERSFDTGKGHGFTERTVHPAGAPPLDWWNIPLLEGEEETRYGPKPDPSQLSQGIGKPAGRRTGERSAKEHWASRELAYSNPLGAPPLDWWNIPPGGFSGAHYAVFPPELCIKPIKAMCPEKVCRQCGEPTRRITEPTGAYAQVLGKGFSDHTRDDLGRSHTARAGVGAQTERGTTRKNALRDELGASLVRTVETTGWSDCGHGDWRPGLVLDPFGGSGTTALVATGHGRDCILIDIDERNYELALQRVGPFILERAG